MGSLRADALRVGRFIERRADSIGTLSGSSQRKVSATLVLGAVIAGFTLLAQPARAAGQAAASPTAPVPTSSAPASAPADPAPPPAPAPNPPSPFTGGSDGQATPLPPAPPPPASAGGPSDALPVPPPPKGTSAAPRPGTAGSDLPPLPPPPRGVHFHDGFYLRLALGLGASGALVSSDAKSVPNYSFAGGGATADVWLGGTPTPGLAMGGVLSLLSVKSTTRRVDGDSRSGDVSGTMGLVGFFADGFPDPERGFHFGAAWVWPVRIPR